MKLFGEYLVNKGVISQEVLVKALLEQTKALSLVAEVIWDKGLLSSEQMLEVFKLQMMEQSGFMDAAKKLGLWSDAFYGHMEEMMHLHRMPLGQVLVQMRAATLEEITHHLDDFLSEQDHPPSSIEKKEPVMPAASLEAPPLFHVTPELQSILNAAFQIDPVMSAKNGAYKSAQLEIHQLKEVAQKAMAQPMEDFLSLMEGLLEELCCRDLSSLDSAFSLKIQQTGQAFIDFLLDIQEKNEAKGKEEDIFSHEAIKVALRDASAMIEMLKFDLGFLDPVNGAQLHAS